MDTARSSNMLYAPLPMLVFDVTTGEILWCNDMFMQLTAQKEKIFETAVDAVIPDFTYRWLIEGKQEYPEQFRWNDRIYRVFGALSRPEPEGGEQPTLATTYWMDITESEQMRQTLELTKPLLAILMVDNYEELMKACPENKRSALLAALEEQMNTASSTCWKRCGWCMPARACPPRCPSAWDGTRTASSSCSRTRRWRWRWRSAAAEIRPW